MALLFNIAFAMGFLVLALFGHMIVGLEFAMIGLGILVALYLIVRFAPPGLLPLLVGLSFVGMLFGTVWIFIGFAAAGPLVGFPMMVFVLLCFAINRYGKGKLSGAIPY